MSSAQPKIDPFWRGSFNICKEDVDIVGVVAHLSTKAAPEASMLASLFPTSISYKFLPSAEASPKIADRSIEEEIDIYFFPENGRSDSDYYKLLNKMFTGDFALRTEIGNRELLVFTSVLLPAHCKRLEKKHYLWGIFMKTPIDGGSASVGCEGDSELVSNPAKEIPLEQLTEDSNNSITCIDQSTDASFLQLVDALNEGEESADDTEITSHSVQQVGSYSIEASLGPTLQAIFNEYGDIAQSCPIEDTSVRSRFLEEFCRDVKELEGVEFAGCHVRSLGTVVANAEKVGLNVGWLRQRHENLLGISKEIKGFRALQKDVEEGEVIAESEKKKLKLKKAENKKLDEEMQTKEQQMASLKEENRVLASEARLHRRIAKKFIGVKSLADGLI